MLRAALLTALLLAVAPAFAQQAPAQPTLRPSIGVTPAPPRADAQTPTPAPPPPIIQTPAFSPMPKPPTADQCRTACAQSYYFCLAENEVQDCAPAWGQCRLACGTTPTLTMPTTAPR